ncbi:LAME_0H04192g1_1 [Lachancea meyersii CBS 8951]|uniref:LAME_0H04192g1_1 n=1 Tax=Lachancea meyersii CBS 8951 TaxID=1266667 RepID=A0A1G4KDX4_9SACH|nr:LAME_0H04192g1_1 [Lachancea meyersii CBS 8951]
MKELEKIFEHSVNQAVEKSLRESKALVVYCSIGDDLWLEKWLTKELGNTVKDSCILLKLLREAPDFPYFKQICPQVSFPSVSCIVEGQIAAVLTSDNAAENRDTLLACLKLPLGRTASPDEDNKAERNTNSDEVTIKDQTSQKATQIYQNSIKKQWKIDKEERERIIQLVKADREEFQAKRRMSVDPAQLQTPSSTLDSIRDNIKNTEHLLAKTCILQIRLLNGHSITHQFASSANLNAARQWVDTNRNDGDAPYVFLRSIPRETFMESDELKTLAALQLTPRSVLILKAVENDTNRPRVVDAQGPGLLGKMFKSLSGWWGSGKVDQDEKLSRPVSRSNIAQMEDSSSIPSSRYVSPANSPQIKHQLGRNPSELSLPSRPVSPNIFQFVNADDENSEDDSHRKTFNGNSVKLEDKKDDGVEIN